jgi:thiol-disulfide isomerase/thioredoxin
MMRLLLAILCCFGVGCNRSGADSVPPAASTVQILNYEGIEKLIASKRGKVVVVDVWSTSCPECVKTFPEFVALAKRFGPDKLACISLSLDFEGLGKPEDRLPDVQKFLSERGATFENVLASEADDVICKKMEIPAPPAVFVFDRDGNLKQRFLHAEKPGEAVYQEVGSVVDELLK